MDARRWSRGLLWMGTTALVLGAIDPLEGSLVIVAAAALVLVAAQLGHLRARRWVAWGGALAMLGVATLWAMSAMGGVGPSTGRSYWWMLLVAPYPIGWILSLTGAIRGLRERT
ncbi:MAG TPA: hypothetical protein VFS59_12195 [Gemmatimonadaceae bacterium]|nr:hypothetical protein [Gemmatimonadaceae bacterium]